MNYETKERQGMVVMSSGCRTPTTRGQGSLSLSLKNRAMKKETHGPVKIVGNRQMKEKSVHTPTHPHTHTQTDTEREIDREREREREKSTFVSI